MGTASFEFLGFALCVVIVFNLLTAVAWRQFVLLAASLVFLTFFSTSPLAWVPFAAFLVFGYVSLRLLQKGAGARGFVPMVIACIAAFVWLKKYAFIPADLFLHYPYVTLGLSYIFFRLLHLLIDAHGGQIGERVSAASYLNYTLNFTTLLSGPIQTYQGFAAYQLAPAPLRLDVFDAGQAMERIVVGFFKVNVLSLALSMMQTQALTTLHAADPFGTRVLQGMLIVGIYPLYLYCNFSGYIDMVIGIARFLRIELPENFNRPFSATNFMMFWSRWHITLSQWLRTYVYNTLLIASMRRFQGAAIAPYLSVFAIFVTFFLVGLWHGQTAEFLFFGLLQGGGVGTVQLYQTVLTKRLGKKGYKALAANAIYTALCRGLTFAWFAFTLLWFWSHWTQIGELAAKLGPAAAASTGIGILIAATLILALWETLRASALSVKTGGEPLLTSRYCRVVIDTALAVISIATVALVNAPAPDLVYKAF
jgi:D-alanyl-lipoteichoic acid acyltransferase DltB (MBOAT superfamily)